MVRAMQTHDGLARSTPHHLVRAVTICLVSASWHVLSPETHSLAQPEFYSMFVRQEPSASCEHVNFASSRQAR